MQVIECAPVLTHDAPPVTQCGPQQRNARGTQIDEIHGASSHAAQLPDQVCPPVGTEPPRPEHGNVNITLRTGLSGGDGAEHKRHDHIVFRPQQSTYLLK